MKIVQDMSCPKVEFQSAWATVGDANTRGTFLIKRTNIQCHKPTRQRELRLLLCFALQKNRNLSHQGTPDFLLEKTKMLPFCRDRERGRKRSGPCICRRHVARIRRRRHRRRRRGRQRRRLLRAWGVIPRRSLFCTTKRPNPTGHRSPEPTTSGWRPYHFPSPPPSWGIVLRLSRSSVSSYEGQLALLASPNPSDCCSFFVWASLVLFHVYWASPVLGLWTLLMDLILWLPCSWALYFSPVSWRDSSVAWKTLGTS